MAPSKENKISPPRRAILRKPPVSLSRSILPQRSQQNSCCWQCSPPSTPRDLPQTICRSRAPTIESTLGQKDSSSPSPQPRPYTTARCANAVDEDRQQRSAAQTKTQTFVGPHRPGHPQAQAHPACSACIATP